MDKKLEGGLPIRRGIITVQIILDIVIWLTVALPTLYLFLRGVPHERGFYCDDDSLGFPYVPDTITTSFLIVAGFTVSIIVVIMVEVLNCMDKKCRRPCQPVGSILLCAKHYAVFLVGFIIQELAVEVVKNKMGILRPNFFDVCKPSFNRTLCPSYITQYKCLGNDQNEDMVRDSRKSFPSGHAAFSMYIAAFFCIYVQKRLQIKFSRVLKLFLQAGLVFMAILCGLSRIKDNKHRPTDVIAGFILGISVAVFVCKMVGQDLLDSNGAVSQEQLPEHIANNLHDCCCSTEQQTPDSEPQTPSFLLPNEYFHRNLSQPDISSPKLNPLQNNKSWTLPPIKIIAVEGLGNV